MSNEQPGLRIGHREREQARRLLELQADEGRLAPAELTERFATVEAAQTRDELGTAFVDLPVDPPTADIGEFSPYPPAAAEGQLPVPTPSAASPEPTEPGRLPTSPRTKRIGAIVMAAMWPAVVGINFLFGWHLWWLFVVAAFSAGWVAWAFGIGDKPNKDD